MADDQDVVLCSIELAPRAVSELDAFKDLAGVKNEGRYQRYRLIGHKRQEWVDASRRRLRGMADDGISCWHDRRSSIEFLRNV